MILTRCIFSTLFRPSIDRAKCDYYHEGYLPLYKDNYVGDVNVGQDMEISFYFTLHSPCLAISSWCNIMQIGNHSTLFSYITDRSPGIWINTNIVIQKLAVHMQGDLNSLDMIMLDESVFDVNSITNDGKEHKFYFRFSLTRQIIKIDGVTVYDMTGFYPNNRLQYAQPIYFLK